MDNHTPEPWTANGSRMVIAKVDGVKIVIAATKLYIRTLSPCVTQEDQRQAAANARRIVACVNACRGIATEHLEAGAAEGLLARIERHERFMDAAVDAYLGTDSDDVRDCLARLLGKDIPDPAKTEG